MHRKEVTHSDGSYEKKSRRRDWLTIWDKVKSHGTFIDWWTGREWPVNCMTVISAWWRSNMPFQGLSGPLNYNITRSRQEVESWRSDELETRCGRESHHPAEGAFGTPDWVWRPVGEKMLGWEYVPERLGPLAPGWAAQENENDTWRCPERLGKSLCCSLCLVSNSLSHTNLYNKYIFFKEVFARLYYCVNMYCACICVYMHIYHVAKQYYDIGPKICEPHLNYVRVCVCLCTWMHVYVNMCVCICIYLTLLLWKWYYWRSFFEPIAKLNVFLLYWSRYEDERAYSVLCDGEIN